MRAWLLRTDEARNARKHAVRGYMTVAACLRRCRGSCASTARSATCQRRGSHARLQLVYRVSDRAAARLGEAGACARAEGVEGAETRWISVHLGLLVWPEERFSDRLPGDHDRGNGSVDYLVERVGLDGGWVGVEGDVLGGEAVGRGLATGLVVDVLPRKAEADAVAEGGLEEVADLCEGGSEESTESVGTNIELVKADDGGFSVLKRERQP
ncbi:Unknown protein, partial [Striga hermonthica]